MTENRTDSNLNPTQSGNITTLCIPRISLERSWREPFRTCLTENSRSIPETPKPIAKISLSTLHARRFENRMATNSIIRCSQIRIILDRLWRANSKVITIEIYRQAFDIFNNDISYLRFKSDLRLFLPI